MAYYKIECPSLQNQDDYGSQSNAVVSAYEPNRIYYKYYDKDIYGGYYQDYNVGGDEKWETLLRFNTSSLQNYKKKKIDNISLSLESYLNDENHSTNIGGTLSWLNQTYSASTVTYNNQPQSNVAFFLGYHPQPSRGSTEVPIKYYRQGFVGYDGSPAPRNLYDQLSVGFLLANKAKYEEIKYVDYGVGDWFHRSIGYENSKLIFDFEDLSISGAYPYGGTFVNAETPNTFTAIFGAFDAIEYPIISQADIEIKDVETQTVSRLNISMSVSTDGISQINIPIPVNTMAKNKNYQWRVKLGTDDGGTEFSAWYDFTTSDSIPNAPLINSPSSSYLDGSVPTDLLWTHNIDTGTAQYAYDVDYKQTGDWVSLSNHVVSSESKVEIPANTLSSGLFTWRVRTYNTDNVPSEYAESAANIILAKPNTPIITKITSEPRTTISWQSTGQESFELYVGEKRYYQYGSAKSMQIDDYLQDGRYNVKLRIQNSQGAWSDYAESTVSIKNVQIGGDIVFSSQSVSGGVKLSISSPEEEVYHKTGNPITFENVPSEVSFSSVLATGSAYVTDNALFGASQVIVSNGAQSQSYTIDPPAYGIDDDTHDTIDLVSGDRTTATEIKQLTGAEPWEYDSESLTSAGGDVLNLTDTQEGGEFTKLEVEGKFVETGTGTKSPDNPYTLTGTTKLTVSDGTAPHDYLLPQTLYDLPDGTADTFEMVAGVGTQNVGKVVLNGTQTTFLFAQATSAGSVFKYYNAGNNTTGSITGRIQSDKLLEGGVGEWIYGKDSYYGGNVIAFCLLNSRTGIVVTDTADQKLAKLKTFLSANPITVLYEMATPIAITGTAREIPTYTNTNVSTDGGGDISATYVNNSPVLYAQCAAALEKIGLCTHFANQAVDSDWHDVNEAIGLLNGILYLKISKNVAKTITTLESWLLGQTVKFVSKLAEVITSAGTQQTIVAYSPTTIISINIGNIDAERQLKQTDGTKYILRDGVPIAKIEDTQYFDFMGAGKHEYIYRVANGGNYFDSNASSAEPSMKYTLIATLDEPEKFIPLSYKIGEKPRPEKQVSKQYNSKYFSGRSKPVIDVTEHYDVTWSMEYVVTRENYLTISTWNQSGAPVILRNNDGNIIVGIINGLKSIKRERNQYSITFGILEQDYNLEVAYV